LILTGIVVGDGVAALMVIGMIGAFMFILIQLVLLVDFAHAWNERWLGNYEESQSRVWFTGTIKLNIHCVQKNLTPRQCTIEMVNVSAS